MMADEQNAPPEIPVDRLDAVIFDLEGVITDTAAVHAAAWKRMFDQFLAKLPDREHEDHRPFSHVDYFSYDCAAVLDAAGITELFDARVDRVDADELGLNGTPDTAVFIEAAGRLTVPPARAAVVEDALAGVEAVRRGGLGLVIGVDRSGHAEDLRERGADILVSDLGDVRVSAKRGNAG
jgi:beta-phosphoglucomutase-like phosphatase (HAD superfamily)